ncbi:MAG: L,D-transpeptidase [Bryobacteraceae bacterium]|nr:L,D-transpeptidase [Bryobacteraceae bacterium]
MKTEILVILPADRNRLGRLVVDTGGKMVFGPVDCFGRADDRAARARGNANRDPLKPFGDTPTGMYRCHLGSAPAPAVTRTYGPHGWVALDPVSGPALRAKKNGRFGLLIHGGDLNAAGRLRPTYGCVRVSNGDMEGLMRRLREAGGGVSCRVEEG